MTARIISILRIVCAARIQPGIASAVLLVSAISACSSEAPIPNNTDQNSIATSVADETNAVVSSQGFLTVANAEAPELGLAQAAVEEPAPEPVAAPELVEAPESTDEVTENNEQQPVVETVVTSNVQVETETPIVVQIEPEPVQQLGTSSPADINYDNDHLPLAGLFYGTPKGGMQVGNGPLAIENSIRFRAERSGMVQAVRYNNRTLRASDINDRCDVNGAGSEWCDCKDAGLDHISCGYTLGNSYHVGSGGLITIELQTDDGSADHLPSNIVLAHTQSYIPIDISDKFPTMNFTAPVQVQAGQIYHLVFRNDKPPTDCKLRRATPAEAAACPRDQGTIGLNGAKHANDPSPDGPFGPYLGKTGKGIHIRNTVGGSWRLHDDVVAFYELQYTDGEYVGDVSVGVENQNYGKQTGTRSIEGATHARQVFTVEHASREVNGLWLQIGHPYDRSINYKPLQIKVKDTSGGILASGVIAASKECSEMSVANGDGKTRTLRDEWMCRTWAYTDLDQPVTLLEGSQYSVEFSAASGAAFDLSTYISTHQRDTRNTWENAFAEYSTDSGDTWQKWATTWSERDLPMLFTVMGGPKFMP